MAAALERALVAFSDNSSSIILSNVHVQRRVPAGAAKRATEGACPLQRPVRQVESRSPGAPDHQDGRSFLYAFELLDAHVESRSTWSEPYDLGFAGNQRSLPNVTDCLLKLCEVILIAVEPGTKDLH